METGKNLMVSLADVLDAQAQVESGGNPTARSYKNARGLHQFMPATWRQYGRGDINDPVASRDAAARYLTDLYKKHGSLPLALAAYNGGDKGAEYLARNPQFMHHPDKSAPINTWRHQTGDYVNKIMTALDRMSPIRSANAAEDENPEANDYAQTDDPITSNEPERTQRTQQPEIDDWQEMPKTTAPAAEIDDWQEVAPTQQNNTTQDDPMQQSKPREQSIAKNILNTAGDIGLGALQGAGNIGATLMQPIDYAMDKTGQQNVERRRSLTEGLKNLGAETESIPFKAGEFGSEMAGTWAAGGALSKAGKVARYAPQLATALESSGMASTKLAPRLAGGAISGAAQAGLINPDEAGTGAAIGASLPLAGKAAMTGVRAMTGKVSPAVASLAQKAEQLGIDIPADRITNSKPLNALAASLEYIPLSGRSGSIEKMTDQFKTALSKTMGENTSNLREAVNKAETNLGSKFDSALSSNNVIIDNTFMRDLMDAENLANKELVPDKAKIINNVIDDIYTMTNASGEIDGQAAYNIKKTLDRLSKNNETGWYATQLKKSLMSALERSMTPADAAAFAKVRQQYGAYLTLDDMVKGVDGDISPARVANIKSSHNPEINDLKDIAHQFMKTRESPHGAAQRVTLGGLGSALTGYAGGIPAIVGGMAAGNVTNRALSSKAARKLAINGINPNRGIASALSRIAIPASSRKE